jgi:hypothetical protein
VQLLLRPPQAVQNSHFKISLYKITPLYCTVSQQEPEKVYEYVNIENLMFDILF